MAASPILTFLARLLSLVALGLLTVAVIVGATPGPGFQLLRDRAIRMLGGIPADRGAAEAAPQGEGHAHGDAHHHDHAHDDHDHDDHGHDEANSLRLSDQARRSIGLREGEIALSTFDLTISVPGIVVERRGRSKLTIIAPITGSVAQIFATEGEAIAPGQPLFEIRLTHEELVQAQANLLKTTEEVDIVRREIVRLEGIGPEGIVAVKTILERKYELQKLEAVRTAERQALLLHGLSESQVDEILLKRTLLGKFVVRAPAATTPPAGSTAEIILTLQDLAVERGQHVTAGDTLAILADHASLLIEGEAFEQDIPHISRVARDGGSVTGIAEADANDEPRTEGLRIVSIASRLDPESRTLHFYVLLPNSVVRDTKEDGDRRFVEWRYKPGQRMQLHIPVEEWTDRIVLPVEAVAQEGLENYVFRVNGDHFDRQPVHVEHRDPQVIVIANDGALFPGDRIALSAAQQLQVAVKTKAGGGVDPHAGHNH